MHAVTDFELPRVADAGGRGDTDVRYDLMLDIQNEAAEEELQRLDQQ